MYLDLYFVQKMYNKNVKIPKCEIKNRTSVI